MKKIRLVLKKTKIYRKKILPFVIGAMIVLIPLFILTIKLREKAYALPWSPTLSSWANRLPLTLTNNSGQTVHTNTTYKLNINTAGLGADIQADCDDLRVVYQPNATVFTELPRYYAVNIGATDCSDSKATMVYFPLQADITNNSSSTDYYIYYNNPSATAPSNTTTAFNVGSKNATLVSLFNNTLNGVEGEVPTYSSTAYNYYSSKIGLTFDGYNDYATASDSASLSITGDLTVEAWIYVLDSSEQTIVAKWDETTANNDRSYRLFISAGGYPAFSVSSNGTAVTTVTGASTMLTGTWHHLAGVYDNSGTLDIYLDGVKDTTQVTGGPTSLDDNASLLYLGAKENTSGNPDTFFYGYIDEVRISNSLRYTGNFTTINAPYERDSNTKALYHLDEGYDDSRNTGKSIDDSGNGNHQTLSGPRYIGGVKGNSYVNNQISQNQGYVMTQSYSAPETGVWFERGITNEIVNPSFEHATYDISWNAAGSNLTKSEGSTFPYYRFELTSLSLSANASAISGTSNSMDITTTGLTNGDHYVFSFFVYNNTGGSVRGTVDSTVIKPIFNNTVQSSNVTYKDEGGGWWRVYYTSTASGTSNDFGFEVQPSKAVYIDGVQLEYSEAYGGNTSIPTTYTDGFMGTGYSWQGTVYNSKSDRDNGNIGYESPNNIDKTRGSISFWTHREYLTTADSETSYLRWTAGTDNQNEFTIAANGNSIYAQKSVGGTFYQVTGTLSGDQWHHVVYTWNDTTGTALYVDGTLANSDPNTSAPIGNAGNDIQLPVSDNTWSAAGVLSNFRIYDNSLSNTEIADIYYVGLLGHQTGSSQNKQDAAGSTAPHVNTLLTWHMDEGYGATLNDSSGNNNYGTISAATWVRAASNSNTQRASYLDFNGTSAKVSRNSDADFDFGTSSFSITGWFKHISTISTQNTIFSRYGSAGYKVYLNSSGNVCFGIDDDASWGPDDSACTTVNYADDTWHNFTAVKTGVSTIAIYVDGKNPITTNIANATGSLYTNSTIYMGVDSGGNSNYFKGGLDEFNIYTTALSAAEAKAAVSEIQSNVTQGTNPTDPLSNGLVGWWKMDENTGTVVNDSSGNSNTGTLQANPATPTWSTGKYGTGLSFDGGDYVLAGTGTSVTNLHQAKFTASAWIYPTANPGSFEIHEILSKGSSVDKRWSLNIWNQSGNIRFRGEIDNASAQYGWSLSNESPTLNQWQLITMTYNDQGDRLIHLFLNGKELTYSSQIAFSSTQSSDSSYQVAIGSESNGSDYFEGRIDESRLYNRSLSPSEISQLYNWSPGPVAYYTFDEGSGTTVNDSSGNTNTGTFTSPQWTAGKFGSAARLSSNAISVADSSSLDITKGMTMSYWMQADNVGGSSASMSPAITDTNDDRQYDSNDYVATNGEDGLGGSYLGAYSGTGEYWGVFRFALPSTIAQGITITSASLVLRGYDTWQWTPASDFLRLYVTDSTDCAQPTANANYKPSLSTGGTTTVWPATLDGGYRWPTPTGGLTWNTTGDNTSVDISALISHLNSSSDLTAGNHVCIWVVAPDANSAEVGFRDFYYNSGSNPAVLNINYGVTPVSSGKGRDTYQMEPISGTLTGYIDTTKTVTTTVDTNWHYITMTYDGITQKLYKDGVLVNSNATTGDINTNNTALTIGQGMIGKLDEMKIYNYARTPQQIIEDMNGGHLAPGSPVGSPLLHYSFDEGYGDTVNNTGNIGSTINGDIAGSGITCPGNNACPTWTTSGKFDKALSFNDANQQNVNFGVANPDFSTFTGMTVTGWVNVNDANPYSDNTIISKFWEGDQGYGNSIFKVYVYQNELRFKLSLDNSWDGSNVGIAINSNTWYHFAAIWDGSNYSIYLNGQKGESAARSGQMTNPNTALCVGSAADGVDGNAPNCTHGGDFFDGSIDEIKLYNFALTENQVKADMNMDSNSAMGGVADHTNEGFVGDPPVGWWKFDENTGTIANDSSGNGNTGTLGAGTPGYRPTWTLGKAGSGLQFDGNDDYISVADNDSLDITSTFTISAWVNINVFPPGGSDNFLAKENISSIGTNSYGFGINSGSNKLRFTIFGVVDIDDTGTALNSGEWMHVAVTHTGTSYKFYRNGILNSDITNVNNPTANAFTLLLGRRQDANFIDGKMDEIKIYDYALSQAQIAYDYNRGAPVAQYDMDECTGDTIHSSSLDGNNQYISALNGTLTLGGSDQTATGDCTTNANTPWYNGRNGKYSSSVNFDGTDDYIETTHTHYAYPTIAAWIKTTSSDRSIFATHPTANWMWIHMSGTNLQCNVVPIDNFSWYSATTTGLNLADGAWHHVACNMDTSGNINAYVDGKLQAQNSTGYPNGVFNDVSDTNDRIGNMSPYSVYFKGQIDDFRIYNYPLTADQIKKVYNEGGAVRFGN